MLCEILLISLESEPMIDSYNENDINQLLDIDESNSSQSSSD